MRNHAERGPLFPGVIFRQDAKHGAMWKGTVEHFTTYGGAEAYIMALKDGAAQVDAVARGRAYDESKAKQPGVMPQSDAAAA